MPCLFNFNQVLNQVPNHILLILFYTKGMHSMKLLRSPNLSVILASKIDLRHRRWPAGRICIIPSLFAITKSGLQRKINTSRSVPGKSTSKADVGCTFALRHVYLTRSKSLIDVLLHVVFSETWTCSRSVHKHVGLALLRCCSVKPTTC